MKTKLVLTLLIAVFAVASHARASWEPPQSLVKITTQNHDQYRIFDGLGMPIVDVRDHWVKALATAEQLAQVRAMGFQVEIILKDYTKEFQEKGYPPMGTPALTGTKAWNFYHTYAQVRDSIKALALRHPTICRVESLGVSVQNRTLWGLRISRNVSVRENEPRLRITGNIHGNEHIGCEVAFYMAYMLADSYGVSPRLTRLVDSNEVFIVPMQNPDGATADTRGNANGVDCNRDYGYMWHGWGGSTGPYSQPESQILRLDGELNPYAVSLTYHSGAELIPYPWSYRALPTQDDNLFKTMAYGFHTFSGYDTINSYRWYQIFGCSSDEAYGEHGNMETIVEVWDVGGYNPPAESIQAVCLRNKEGVIYYLNKGRIGIRGTVTDIASGKPVQALIRLYPLSQGRDWFTYSTSENGDFHRPMTAGTYSLKLSANGYRDTVVTGVTVPDTVNPVLQDVQLTPGDNDAAFRVTAVVQDSLAARTNISLTPWALGMPDTLSYAMGRNGRIVLDMGQGTEITDGPGPDVRITEYPNASHAVQCSVSNSWNGPWISLGSGSGTCTFDLSGHGISIARYIKLGSGTSGYSLDAVEALNHASGVSEETPLRVTSHESRITSFPNPFRTSTTISLSYPPAGNGKVSLSIYDVSGRLVTTLSPHASSQRSGDPDLSGRLTPYEYVWDGTDSRGRSLPGGVYFYRLNSPQFTATEKVVMIR